MSQQKPLLPLKVWRQRPDWEFQTYVLISTCTQLYQYFPKMDYAQIYGHLIEVYHQRLDDRMQHPRPKDWTDSVIVGFSMFDTRADWTSFFDNPVHSGQNLGKKTPENCGIPIPYVIWAKALWVKFGKAKTSMINVLNVDFKKLLTKHSGHMAPGTRTRAHLRSFCSTLTFRFQDQDTSFQILLKNFVASYLKNGLQPTTKVSSRTGLDQ